MPAAGGCSGASFPAARGLLLRLLALLLQLLALLSKPAAAVQHSLLLTQLGRMARMGLGQQRTPGEQGTGPLLAPTGAGAAHQWAPTQQELSTLMT